jgi:O-antigen/teichoic acid export membrane protein
MPSAPQNKNLHDRATQGFMWSFTENFTGQGITFLIGVILARILSPREFGLIGMTGVVFAIIQTFVDSGFSQALIRRDKCTDSDYNTVFIFNLGVAVLLLGIVYWVAPFVALFFSEGELSPIIRVLSISVILYSLSIVQTTKLIKKLDFKTLAKISLGSSLVSGIIAVYLAYHGFGVWSLVWRLLISQFLSTSILWLHNRWMPHRGFDFVAFKELFTFGSKLLFASFINVVFDKANSIVVGRYYNPVTLGYYLRADQISNLPSSQITNVIQRVSYPILVELGNDLDRMRNGFRKLIQVSTVIIFPIMCGLSAVAEPFVLTLLGDRWSPCILYLRIVSIAMMLYPLHAINLNVLNVKGRSDLFLRLEIIKKVVFIPVIAVGAFVGVLPMLWCFLAYSFFAFVINAYYTGCLIQYPIHEQIRDVSPVFILSGIMGLALFSVSIFLQIPEPIKLTILVIFGAILYIILCELTKNQGYIQIKQMALKMMRGLK